MEEVAFAKERSFKRKLMEAQVGRGSGGGGKDNGGQVRRVHIVYFLSRNGRTEHPHLFRVHHFSRNGVHLRDVKRWLSELRGKDMPESFAWSYKRRYRGGYVWQDLLDEDLITPICDNEYVLKGSEISSRTLNNDNNYYSDKEVAELKKSSPFEVDVKDPKYPSIKEEYPQDFSTNTSIEIEESSFGSNVTTQDTMMDHDAYMDEEVQRQADKGKNNSFYEVFLNKNTNNNNSKSRSKKNNNNNSKSKECDDKSVTSGFKTPPSPSYSFGKPSRFSGSRASHMFRNWITCGTNNTHETALVVMNRRKSSRTSTMSLTSEKNSKIYNIGQIRKEQKQEGFEKSFDSKDGSKKSKEDSNNFKPFAAAYKPVNGPNCSQCGRQFKPEKLHTHMKYCRGMKALAKSTNPSPKPKTSRPCSPSSAPLDAFYLTNN